MSVETSLNKFAKNVIKQSRSNLTRKDKNASKKLYNSLGYDLNVSKNSYSLSFKMEEYGEFIDKGVKGVGGTKADGSRWQTKKVDNTLYKYTNKRPPAKAFDKWIVRRGIAPRTTTGQFTSRKSTSFAIANSVYHTGLETTNFLTRPFENEFSKLPDELIEAFSLTVDNILTE